MHSGEFEICTSESVAVSSINNCNQYTDLEP